MLIDLPIEIWSYIFAIRRHDFELLLLKFQKKLQYRISWKNLLYVESWYYESYHGGIISEIPNFIITNYGNYFPYRARIFKVSRIVFKDRHSHRSGYGWGGTEAYLLTFELRLPVYTPQIGDLKIYPRYAFKLLSSPSSCFVDRDVGLVPWL